MRTTIESNIVRSNIIIKTRNKRTSSSIIGNNDSPEINRRSNQQPNQNQTNSSSGIQNQTHSI